jgi:hypothetical protein
MIRWQAHILGSRAACVNCLTAVLSPAAASYRWSASFGTILVPIVAPGFSLTLSLRLGEGRGCFPSEKSSRHTPCAVTADGTRSVPATLEPSTSN